MSITWWNGNTKFIAYNEGGKGFGFNLSLYKGIFPTSIYVFVAILGKYFRLHTFKLYCPY